jgi:hypothetical protein
MRIIPQEFNLKLESLRLARIGLAEKSQTGHPSLLNLVPVE